MIKKYHIGEHVEFVYKNAGFEYAIGDEIDIEYDGIVVAYFIVDGNFSHNGRRMVSGYVSRLVNKYD